MAGLGRVQQLFNRAVLAPIAALLSLTRGNKQEAAQLSKGHGHPLLAKYLKSSNPNANTPGYAYPGYCFGAQEAERRKNQAERKRWKHWDTFLTQEGV